MVSSPDFWTFYADHRTTSLLFRFDLLDLLNHCFSFGFGEENKAAYCDDAQYQEDIENVEPVPSDKAQAKWTECGCQRSERRNQSHSNCSNPGRIQFAHIDLKEAKEERDTSPEDKDHNQLDDAMIASLAILRPLKKDQDEADKRSHREQYNPSPLSPQSINVRQCWEVNHQLGKLYHRAAYEDIEAYLIDDKCRSVIHRIGDKGKTAACDGGNAKTRESAKIKRRY